MRTRWLGVAVVVLLVGVACTGGGGGGTSTGDSGGGQINLTMWMGYTPPPPASQSFEYFSLTSAVRAYEKQHPNVHIDLQYVNSDFALQKATVALQGNQGPDISYQYGTNMPQLAQTPKIVDLTSRVNEAGFNWNDFYPTERPVATVDGKVIGVPALVDNLAIVYNKDLFKKAGLPTPTADWTWDDVRAAAKATTDPSTKTFGLTFPVDGSETSVWQYEAMLWEAGGAILNSDNTKAAFNSPQGVQALTMLQSMQQDGSLYLDFHPDSGKYGQLFDSGKIGMVITGPWDLSGFPHVNYGVQIMPSFTPGGSHQSIAGPDNWVIFDNGPERVDAAWQFLKFLDSPEQVLHDSLAAGHLPLRASVAQMPGFKSFNEKYPGAGTFATNLNNVTQTRPQITQYPRVSTALGQGIADVLLGKATPQEALDQAAQQADGFLAVPA